MHKEQFEIFKQQDLEKGGFDVILDIDGKFLRAHKYILTSVSETLNSWLSDRWTTKDAIIKIKDYAFDNFYEFVCFLYIGDCKLTKENAFKMVDMAEFYGVPCLKEFCDMFLSKMKKEVETIEEMFECAQTYSLPKLTNSIKYFFSGNIDEVCKSETFCAFKKSFIAFLFIDYQCEQKIIFQNVYKWTERHIMNEKSINDENFNLVAIITELNTILHDIEFVRMEYDFLMNFVVEKGFILSAMEMGQIFLDQEKKYCQQIAFKNTYELAKKQALKKQEMFPEENFNLVDSVNSYLVHVVKNLEFFKMNKKFLVDFVVANGVISIEKATRVYLIRVDVRKKDSVISGVFRDNFGIRAAIQRQNSNRHEQTFSSRKLKYDFKFDIPETPSSVQKMKGCDWYLCLEADGILTFKHHSLVERSDYLLAEMKSNKEFQLNANVRNGRIERKNYHINACINFSTF